ncbi:hypothetical protein DACRYDRAFT_106292 [Dacryopinax primogenitus]|uniref:Ribonucleotide reductase large subunit C-terminal domain-containing protein n=1 Tax=Dacryopinax primogenitus (strain DJM 731) TaxID=1858805 RepID=M5G4G1_DACPD|nr:uncharacterized protein DACRYDRAFT_106292 [Dacryopinax primogenitus]EJU03120.1 hypothetical protein DACRYDRAFT_106292 [Dacryopinax primogenitus]
MEYSPPDKVAICNLASIALPSSIQDGQYDFQKLHAVSKVVAFNLNWIIDVNYYTVPEAPGPSRTSPESQTTSKAICKTVWEILQKKILNLAMDLGMFICQHQCLNVHLQSPILGQLTSMHFYCWKKGLKTSMYCLCMHPTAQAIQFTLVVLVIKQAKDAQHGVSGPAQAVQVMKPHKPRQSMNKYVSIAMNDMVALACSSTLASATVTTLMASPDYTMVVKVESSSAPLPTPGASASGTEQPLVAAPAEENSKGKGKTEEKEIDPKNAAALERVKQRKYKEVKLQCSLKNMEACLMCSG